MALPAIRDLADPSFDPFMDEKIAFGEIEDPWPLMAEMRAKAPVSEGQYRLYFGGAPDPATNHMKYYTAWSYDAAEAILTDPEGFNSTSGRHKVNVEPAFGRILLVMDPPEHTHYRRTLQTLFSPKRIKTWVETIIRPVVHEAIDRFAGDGRADLVAQFTQGYPFEIAYRLLDLPRDDIAVFHKLAATQTFCSGPLSDKAKEAGRNLGDYLQALVDERKTNPGDDLVSELVRPGVDGERLEDEIAIAFLRHILNASADTSYRTTGSLLVALLERPELLAQVREDHRLVPLAIEEALRWDGPVIANPRTVTRDIEIAGTLMEAGAVVDVVQASANRDETRFEDPDAFDIHRSRAVRHMGFGAGPHTCVGAQLARTQIREAVVALLDRLPGLRVDPAYPPPRVRGYLMRTPPEVNVLFDPEKQ